MSIVLVKCGTFMEVLDEGRSKSLYSSQSFDDVRTFVRHVLHVH